MNGRTLTRLLPALLLCALSASSAQRAPSPNPTGTVSGTVTCTDTNLPGRLTEVSLTPVASADPLSDLKIGKPEQPPMVRLYQTRLDGTFLIQHVPVGHYYIVAQKPGYLSPASLYTESQIRHPATPELAHDIAEHVQTVTVVADQTTTVQIQLHRSASVSGTLRFDDGSPASDLGVGFQRQESSGKWVFVADAHGNADDLGHFRVAGLPAGDYRMTTGLNRKTTMVSGVFGEQTGGAWSSFGSSLTVYYGDTFFRKDARLLHVEDGQEVSADLTIPLSKLHAISGTLVDARTGKVLNAGKIEILEPGQQEGLTSVELGGDDPGFRVEYVPEGTLIVRVTGAKLVIRQLQPMPPGSFGTPQYKETVLQTYDPYEAPLVITTDLQALSLPIPPHTDKAHP